MGLATRPAIDSCPDFLVHTLSSYTMNGTSKHHRYDEKRRIFYVSKHVDNLNMEKKVEWIIHECSDFLLATLTFRKKHMTTLNAYLTEQTNKEPFLSAEMERTILMLIADTMALNYINADSELLKETEVENISSMRKEEFEEQWTLQKVIESLTQKIEFGVEQIGDETMPSTHMDIALQYLYIVLMHCDPNSKRLNGVMDQEIRRDGTNGC